ncbi:DUF2690 domain-containing protein [Solwaraspora sp. WMMD1047]|uniref:DUF2690 domain-containing protein n=1 Tax=Solwaraspora sp. WMMD1047 TaxID=3016102 RepID=UPI0024171622|nr:DUF2690 domain-containing protein [Solwaraspora sp. WMMD1047]MDG4829613.1 DUF2690 domain-containing protein [Solwaraspora sp. WMMD1047]
MRMQTWAASRSSTLSKSGLRLLALAIVLVAGVLSAGPASAAPSQGAAEGTLATCSGNSCNYQDPQATGCSAGAANFDEWTYMGYRVEHRYSPTCRAVWVRATYVSGNVASFGAHLETRLTAGNVRQYVTWRGNTGWSRMYSSAYYSRAVAVTSSGTHYGDWL